MILDHSSSLLAGRQAGLRYALSLPRVAPTGLTGAQMGHRPGSSLEFMDHRDYQPGDDLRRIDWSAYARTDRLTVKLYREEVSPHLDVLLDGSRSMNLENTAKLQAALGLAALLATAAENAGFSRRVYQTDSGCREVAGGHLSCEAWQGLSFDSTQPPGQALAQHAPSFRRRGMRVFLSDLLWMGDPMQALGPLAHGATLLVIVQVLAEMDVNPPTHGNIRLTDSETGQSRDLFIDAAAQQLYRQNLARHQQLWQQACQGVGARLVSFTAETLLRDWNIEDLLSTGVLRTV